jgi:hypothetical protein
LYQFTKRVTKLTNNYRGISLLSTSYKIVSNILLSTVQKVENTAVGIRHADHVAPSISKKLVLTSLTSGGRSVGIVRSRTEDTEFFYPPPLKVKSLCTRR